MSSVDALYAQCEGLTLLSEGGQKRVWTGTHPDYGPVVIKMGRYGSVSTLERITREVAALRKVESKFYPKNFDFAVDPLEQRFVMVEERLQALELGKVRERFHEPAAVLKLMRLLVTGLTEIWQRRIVHRDLKPQNILITEDDEPRIIDLGIARFLDEESLTATLAAHGPATPVYAAPEQLANRRSMIDARTDFFLLGIVGLELLHGFHPFDPRRVGNQSGILDNIATGIYVPPPDHCDDLLSTFLQRCLEVRPIKRFRTPQDVMTFLQEDS